jgi:NTE family protein
VPFEHDDRLCVDRASALRRGPVAGTFDRRPRIGVVFGAGGVQGNAYLCGAVAALHAETGFEPRTATVLVGTSAGSVHAALYGAGLPALFGLWRNRGGRLPVDWPEEGPAAGLLDGGHDDEAETLRDIFALARGLPRLGPSSPALLARALVAPWAHRPEAVLSAWLPEGVLSNHAIGEALARIIPAGWVAHPRTWITTVRLRDGQRVVFGRPGAPPAAIQEAVRASCAIPGVYQPIRIGGQRYVDGGVHSPSNADLVAGLDLDLVVVLNPMSSLEGVAARGVVDRALGRVRRLAGRRLGRELRLLHEREIPTLVLQPTRRDLATFTRNLMDPRPRRAVAETAVATTRAALRDPAAASAVTLLHAAARASVA